MADGKEMDLKKVKELIDLMKANDLVELEVDDGNNKIVLKRPSPNQPVVTQVPMAAVPAQVPSQGEQSSTAQEDDQGLVEVKSPMVGTFYSSPSPDSDDFVSVGDMVDADTVVCIVEAMKVMNEIKADVSGTIVRVMCQAGQAIEYGQALFKVKPD